jgi:alkylation response protein AidB-like acyl-CoA dehydrogenase
LILNGTKSDSIAADRAEWVLAAVQAGDEPLLFAVPADAVRFAAERHRLGLRAACYGTVQLDGCAVSADQIMARGAPAARAIAAALERDVLLWSARAVGTARAAFEYAVRYATERQTFGKPIAEHQGVAFMLADMGIAVDAARYLVWHAAWAIDSNLSDLAEHVHGAAAFATEATVRVTTDAVQVLGGHGYIQDHPVEMWMRDARTIANLAAQSVSLLRRLATP